jgi:hypothetical protein
MEIKLPKSDKGRATAQRQLDALVDSFKTGEVAAPLAIELLRKKAGDDRPMDNWSLRNRLVTRMSGTEDARTFKGWEKVGRKVKKGASAIYIWRPVKAARTRITEQPDGTEKKETVWIVIGFDPTPRFRFEDTEGEPMEVADYEPKTTPPLVDVAAQLGIEVSYTAAERLPGAYGSYNPKANHIRLATHDESTWFHELAHAAHKLVLRKRGSDLKGGQDPKQEAVAELTAAVLGRVYGVGVATDGNAYKYIANYAENGNAGELAMSVVADVTAVLDILLPEEGAERKEEEVAA